MKINGRALSYDWQPNRLDVIEQVRRNPIALTKDGQFDSPGQSTKYCMYSFLQNKTKKINYFQSEQVQGHFAYI